MSFPFPCSDTFLPSSLSLSRWLPLSIQLISNRLYWHNRGILMVPKLCKKEKKNMLYYICLSMSSSLRSLSASLLSPCQRTITAASRKSKPSPTSSPIFLSPSSVWVFFHLLSTCKSPEMEIFYLSFLLEMKRHQYRWIGGYGASLLVLPFYNLSHLGSPVGLSPFLSLFV